MFTSTLISFCILASLIFFLTCFCPRHILILVMCPHVQFLYASCAWNLPRAYALAKLCTPVFLIVPLHRWRVNTRAWSGTRWSLRIPSRLLFAWWFSLWCHYNYLLILLVYCSLENHSLFQTVCSKGSRSWAVSRSATRLPRTFGSFKNKVGWHAQPQSCACRTTIHSRLWIAMSEI